MKKLREDMDKWFEKLDRGWRTLPLSKQRKYILYFFVGYLLLTAGVIFKVGYDTGKSNNDRIIEPIENPIIKKKGSPAFVQDTLSKKIKNKVYEKE